MSSMAQSSRNSEDDGRLVRFPVLADPTHWRAGARTTYEASLLQGQDDPRLDRQFRRLAEQIVAEFPADVGGSLLFTGVASGGHVADVAAQVAKKLADMHCGEVLLIDADFGDKVLTQRFVATGEKGLAEAFQGGLSGIHSVVNTTISKLKFLPAGESAMSHRTLKMPTIQKQTVKSVLDELKRNFRFAVLAGGAEQRSCLAETSRHCDGTYLVIQVGFASKDHVLGLERELVAVGARLLGCIATGTT